MTNIREYVTQRIEESDARVERQREKARSRQVRAEAEDWLKMWGLDMKLPAGEQGDSTACVLANALGGSFGGDNWEVSEDRTVLKMAGFDNVQIPPVVSEFISRFDRGEYPDLIVDNGGDDD
jgi:hypothetical protein